jgi:hypothetical protein
MSNISPHITSTARKQPATIIGRPRPRPRQAEREEPTSVHDRARVGRFDDGMSTYPDRNRARVGRFDDGMSTAAEHGQAPIGSLGAGTADDALAA